MSTKSADGPATNETIRAILEAGALCLARLGQDKTSIQVIADAAGLNRTTVYRYFSDRNQLLNAITEYERDKQQAEIRARIASDAALEDALATIGEVLASTALAFRVPEHCAGMTGAWRCTTGCSVTTVTGGSPAWSARTSRARSRPGGWPRTSRRTRRLSGPRWSSCSSRPCPARSAWTSRTRARSAGPSRAGSALALAGAEAAEGTNHGPFGIKIFQKPTGQVHRVRPGRLSGAGPRTARRWAARAARVSAGLTMPSAAQWCSPAVADPSS